MTPFVISVLLIQIFVRCAVTLKCRCDSPDCLENKDHASFGECYVDKGTGLCVRKINIMLSNIRGDIRIARKWQEYRCENISKNDPMTNRLHSFQVRVPLHLANPLIIEYRCRAFDHCASSFLFDPDQCGQDENASEDANIQGADSSILNRYLLPRISPPERNLSTSICTCIRPQFELPPELSDDLDTNLAALKKTAQEEKRNECSWTNYDYQPYQICKSPSEPTARSTLSQKGLRASLLCSEPQEKVSCHNLQDMNKKGPQSENSDSAKSGPVPLRCEWRCRYRHNCNNANEFTNFYCAALEELRKTAILTIGISEIKRQAFNASSFGSRQIEADQANKYQKFLTCGCMNCSFVSGHVAWVIFIAAFFIRE